MSLIQCIDLGIEFAGNYVLRGINCTIEHNSKIGLIGPNGCGKTTLIKMILGTLGATEGAVLKAKKCQIGYLAQNTTLNPSLRMIDYIESSRPDIQALKRSISLLSATLEKNHDDKTNLELNKAIEQMHTIGGFEHDNEIKYVLTSLGFPDSEWDKMLSQFSGGEQTRICLAGLLLTPFDLLILDEPTNHLDIAMTRWLERYLGSFGRPFMVVSHDRVFLDNTVSTIYAISQGQIQITKGNYSSYYEADKIARMSQERAFERQQKFIAETESFIQKNIAGQKTAMAKSRLKMLARMDIIQAPKQQKQIKLRLDRASRSGNDVFILQDVDFGISEDRILAKEVNISAYWQERIALIGPNGCGKSTLLKILMGESDILKGKLKVGASLKIGYYDQHQNALDENLNVLDTLWSIVPNEPRGYVLSWLARFGFTGDNLEKQVSVLSGGEKSRLYLCVLIHEKPNLLIMDEPTNHLDIPMHDALLEALKSFDGTILFVSHDRHFISHLANKYWVFRKKLDDKQAIYTTIDEPDCDSSAAIELAFAEPEIPKDPPPPREKKRKVNPWHLDQLHKQIEAKQTSLSKLNTRLDDAHAMLADSDTYSDTAKVKHLNDTCKDLEIDIIDVKREIEELEEKYLELACEE